MHCQRLVGGVTSICRDYESVTQLLRRKWLLPRPDTRIQRILITSNPEDNSLKYTACQETDARLESGPSFFVIRDDLLHPIMGGNKLRKLDALLPLLQSASVTDVVTCGGCQSAHTAALAVACAETGLCAHLLLRGERLPVSTGYNLISGMYGKVTYIPRSEYADREAMLRKYAESIAETGLVLWMDGIQLDYNALDSGGADIGPCQSTKRVVIVREGASDAIALLGLIRLVSYLSNPKCFGRGRNLQIVVDCGTGTTAVGLGVAIAILRLPWQILGVMLLDASESYTQLSRRLLDDFNTMWAQDGKPAVQQEALDQCLKWINRPRPRKFGKVLEGEIEACRKIARQIGILLDPVYTLAAWEVASDMSVKTGKETLMLHTGGTLGLFGLAQRYPSHF